MRFIKDWKFWVAILGLLCTIISTAIAVDRHFAALEETAARLQAMAETQQARMAEQLARERIKQLEAEQDSMHRFLINYESHLLDIRNALSRYQEDPRAETEDDVWAGIDAFIHFVQSWRRVQPLLKELLNGTVDRLAAAAMARDQAAVKRLSLELDKGMADKRLLLEKEIENLKLGQR